jgi:cardiolipin synthase
VKGVDVHLIVSQKADHWLVSLAQRSYYEQLLEAGVKVHLYEKKFLHAKHITIDESVLTVGSYNIDIRSFTLNSELMVLGFDREATGRIIEVEQNYLKLCTSLTYEDWSRRPYAEKVVENLARLFSPLL